MIQGVGPAAAVRRSAPAHAAASTGRARFAVGEAAHADAPPPADAASDVALAGLLSLQEQTSDRDGDGAARDHARTILAELATLQRALLGSGDATAIAARLRDMLTHLPVASDPALLSIVRMIALRARIEAARHGLAEASSSA